MNAVSGLGFVGVGILILFATVARSVRSQPAPATQLMLQPVYSGLFATASLLIGFGSTFYHA
jgi:hypothetical protein